MTCMRLDALKTDRREYDSSRLQEAFSYRGTRHWKGAAKGWNRNRMSPAIREIATHSLWRFGKRFSSDFASANFQAIFEPFLWQFVNGLCTHADQ